MRAGATVREAIEAMEAAAIPGGFLTLHYVLPFLIDIANETESAG
jgi:hypothetical protein